MKAKTPDKSQKRLNAVVLSVVVLIPLALITMVWYAAIQRNVARCNLTPEEVVQAFREAGFEIRELTYDVYYPADYIGEQGIEFKITTESETYSILVALYTNVGEARQVAKGINGLNRSMNGGHASAFSYGAIVVQIYPSNESLTGELHRILKQLE